MEDPVAWQLNSETALMEVLY